MPAEGIELRRHSHPLVERHELQVLRADVVGARTNDLAVDALLDDVRGPTGRARDDEQRRETPVRSGVGYRWRTRP